MKTSKKGIALMVLVPMLLIASSAVAQGAQPETFLGFTLEDAKTMGMIAAGVALIVFLAFFTSSGKKKTASNGPVTRKPGNHHHHRMHKLRR